MSQKKLEIPYFEVDNKNLSEEDQNLITHAKQAALRSYSPYSKFSVGAAALLDNGKIVAGSNQENAAYPSGTCAERTTLFYANSTYPDSKVLSLAIIAIQNGKVVDRISPCGACRQVMAEVSYRYNHNFKVILGGAQKTIIINNNKYLLPLTFDGNDLN